MKNNIIGLVNLHNDSNMAPLAENRTLGSTSFLGRYAIMDFALSNFTNSEIMNVGILVKDHLRSVLKHIGPANAWSTNTKIGHTTVMYNEKYAKSPEVNTDVNNILQNDWVLYDSNFDYIVVQPAHVVAKIDYRPILANHIARKAAVTVVYQSVVNPAKDFEGDWLVEVDDNSYIKSAKRNAGDVETRSLATLGIWIINRSVLAEVLRIHGTEQAHPLWDLDDMMFERLNRESMPINAYKLDGFIRRIDSFTKYIRTSMELLNQDASDDMFKPDWPIYTITHDTPPALYGENSSIANACVANGAIVDGTVINSVIGRGVKVAKGAVVKDSIILSGTKIAEGAVIENAVVDKYCVITKDKSVKGSYEEPLYLQQGAIV